VNPGPYAGPALKRIVEDDAFSGALKRSFPCINAGAASSIRGCLQMRDCAEERYDVASELLQGLAGGVVIYQRVENCQNVAAVFDYAF
jgi:hypothetical protein